MAEKFITITVSGPPGSGKTTVARHLANLLHTMGWEVDLDVNSEAGLPPRPHERECVEAVRRSRKLFVTEAQTNREPVERDCSIIKFYRERNYAADAKCEYYNNSYSGCLTCPKYNPGAK